MLVGPVMRSAAALLPLETPEMPGDFGDYRVLSVIAEGGMGIVLRARDMRDRSEVALKMTRSPRRAEASALRREIAVLRGVDHPGIVRLRDDGIYFGMPWMALELLEGRTLCRTIGSRSCGLADTLSIVKQLCGALGHLHDRGVVHRDVKPANVMVGPGCRVTLFDFGLACATRHLALDHSRNNVGIGTAEYAAPEQLAGEPVDGRADIYALGCMLYELVTGRRPFDAESEHDVARMQMHVEPRSPSELLTDMPCPLEELILQMMAKRPEARPATAGEVARRLGHVASRLARGTNEPLDVGFSRSVHGAGGGKGRASGRSA